MKLAAVLAIAVTIGFVAPALAQTIISGPGTYSTIGGQTYGPGGTQTTIGNQTYTPDATYSRIGNQTYGSDGTTYTSIGNQTYGSDGSTSTTIGSQTYIRSSDGSSMTCQKIGSQLICN